ncbi:MAG: HlyD family efflux transporter periplasmic adaptor subunit [Deltaproteobacteria bacterium]|nr:HlyD family efflux transporter periplasmic adaptor subunit [Deltaproteobacteria bacterium]
MMRRACLACAAALACAPASAESSTVVVERGTLVVTVDVAGTLRAVDSDHLGPPPVPEMWNFQIQMMAPEGEEVAEGAPVLAFDASELGRKLEEKIAERDSAATQLELKQSSSRVARHDEQLAIAEAEAALRKAKVKADAPPGITAVIELEKARLDLVLAQNNVEYLGKKAAAAARRDAAEIEAWRGKRDRAEGRVQQIRAAIEGMAVRAPRRGTVIHQTDWEGHKKKPGDNAWRAETVIQVVSLAKMTGDGEIDEVDLGRVALGQAVALRLDASSDAEIAGTIAEISHVVGVASPQSPLKVARVEIALSDAEGLRLRPGMRFRGDIEIQRVDEALLVPLSAVTIDADGAHVVRSTATGDVRVDVELGARSRERVVVERGLDEGDHLLAEPGEPP